MGCRKPLGGWLGAALLGAASIAVAPLLYGGGGDEGVDILPYFDGRGGGSGSGSGDGPSGGGLPHSPAVGWVAVHGRNAKLDANGRAMATGLLLRDHLRGDLFLGDPELPPGDRAETSLDLLTKGPRPLVYGEMVRERGALGGEPWLLLDGRFELAVLSADERLELVSRQRQPALLTILIGKRSTRSGPIGPSFTTIDGTLTEDLAEGRIDLLELRERLLDDNAGTGIDIAVVLSITTPRGVDEAWVAFHSDDVEPLFDVEIRTP